MLLLSLLTTQSTCGREEVGTSKSNPTRVTKIVK